MRHRQWLVVVVVVELLAFGGLIAGAVVRSHRPVVAPITQGPSRAATIQPALPAPKVTAAPFAQNVDNVTALTSTHSPADKRLFAVQQPGVVKIISEQGQVDPTPFLDISSKLMYGGEMGLLGLDFHPKYSQNGFFYVYYINKQKQSVLARYQLDTATGRADPKSEKVLLTLQQTFDNHKGGEVQFGPDGFLYVGFGDGGSGGDPNNQAQNKALWFGKILRLDVDRGDPYSVPPSNPYAKEAGSKPEIWAYGLRNPWRFSFDRLTHNLYIADVGQDNYEEVDVQSAASKGGENYGWRCYEGFHAFNTTGCKSADSYVKPLVEYNHANNRCSITGGYVYRGSREPALAGKYFYADYCSDEVFYAAQQDGAWTQTLATTVANPTTFGEDSAGELYIVSQKTSEIFRLQATANN